jgi:NHL repeat
MHSWRRSFIRSVGTFAALVLAACGGGGAGGGGSGSDPHWYYHFICNADSQCLATNFAGASSGTSSDLGPGAGGQSGCNSLMTFGNINWNIPPVQQWCDNSSGFNPPPVPSVTVTLSPSTVDAGQPSTLSWSSTLMSTCTASGAWSGAKATSGSTTVTQPNPGSFNYGLSCTGGSGSRSASATLTVNTPPPSVNLSVSPVSITLGQSATLSWITWQYTACSASGPWSGTKALNGNESVTPSAAGTFTYTLSCLSATKGSASDSVTLTVNPVSGPAPPAAPAVSLSASNPYPSCMDTGQQNTLTWLSTNATACTASGSWTGPVATSGSQAIYPGAASASAFSTYEYVLNCTGPGGSASASVRICAVPPNGGTPPAVTLSFAATPASISLGESTTLEWASQYASFCTAADEWSGVQSLSGKTTVTPTSTGVHIFTLTCQNYQTSVQRTITLGVNSAAGSDPLAARFYQPIGLAKDSSDNLYIADQGNHTIRKITPAGAVTTLAGLAGSQGFVNAVGGSARFFSPAGVGIGLGGQVLVADFNNNAIRLVAPDTTVTTLAGDPSNLTDGVNYEGTGSGAFFYRPNALLADSAGNVYVSDYGNCVIRRVTPAGVTSTVAGAFRVCSYANGTGTAASFSGPSGLVLVGTDLYVADIGNNRIRKIDSGGVVTTFAGSGTAASVDGAGTGASFNQPYGIAADSQGNLLVTDLGSQKIRKITPAGVVTTLAGNGDHTGVDGTGLSASFYNPSGIAIDSFDNAYVSDAYAIRKITPAGVVTTYAGSAIVSGSNN